MLGRHFLNVIEPLLEETAYADLSVEQIIRAGNISRTTFYAYFSDKADLLLAMTQNIVGDLATSGDNWWQMSDDASKEDLRDALREVLEVYRTHRIIMRAVVDGTAHDPSVREAYDALVALSVDNLIAHIRRGQERGTIRPGIDPEGTGRLLTFMAERSLYKLLGVENVQTDAEFLDPLVEIYWRSLYEGAR